jgi:hypothetical protein
VSVGASPELVAVVLVVVLRWLFFREVRRAALAGCFSIHPSSILANRLESPTEDDDDHEDDDD